MPAYPRLSAGLLVLALAGAAPLQATPAIAASPGSSPTQLAGPPKPMPTRAAPKRPARPRPPEQVIVNKLTFHGDRQRTGWNPLETVLTPDSVASGFGEVWESPQLDTVTIGSTTYAPHLYASPLHVDSLTVTSGNFAGTTFSTLIAATSNGFVYAINAFDLPDGQGGVAVAAGTILWRTSLGAPRPVGGLDGGVPVGVLATPIIDLDTGRLYVASDVTDADGRNWKAFALDLGSGSIVDGWPLTINNSTVHDINVNGPATFQATQAMSQRGALNLSLDGSLLFVPFGAYGDGGAGWMIAVSTGADGSVPYLASAFSGAPSDVAFANGGMWAAGGPALGLDGRLYATTGNSPGSSHDSPGVWGQSLLVWSGVSPFQLAGTYTPWNYCQMDVNDTDLAGSSPIMVPDLDPATTSTPHLVSFGGKQGNLYLVDRDNLPGAVDARPLCGTDPSSDASLIPPDPQLYYGGLPGPLNVWGPYSENCTAGDLAKMRSTPAYFQAADGTGYIFTSGSTKVSTCSRDVQDPSLARLRIVTQGGQPAYLTIDSFDAGGLLFKNPGSPVVSSNGPDAAIVWVIDPNLFRSQSLLGATVAHPTLYAIDATTMAVIWQSPQDQLFVGGKYCTPAVAHGTVFVGTDRIQAFGLGRDQAFRGQVR